MANQLAFICALFADDATLIVALVTDAAPLWISQLSVPVAYVSTTGLHTKVKHADGKTSGNVIVIVPSGEVRVGYCPHCKIRPLVSLIYPDVANNDVTTAILAKAAAAVDAPVPP